MIYYMEFNDDVKRCLAFTTEQYSSRAKPRSWGRVYEDRRGDEHRRGGRVACIADLAKRRGTMSHKDMKVFDIGLHIIYDDDDILDYAPETQDRSIVTGVIKQTTKHAVRTVHLQAPCFDRRGVHPITEPPS